MSVSPYTRSVRHGKSVPPNAQLQRPSATLRRVDSSDRQVFGYSFRVIEPPTYQRVVDNVARALTAPLAAISILNGIIPEGWGKSLFQVVVVNQRGHVGHSPSKSLMTTPLANATALRTACSRSAQTNGRERCAGESRLRSSIDRAGRKRSPTGPSRFLI